MPATVNIEAKVWGDVRFRVLAKALGCDIYSAVGRMAALWGECTERDSYYLPPDLVAMYLDIEVADVDSVLCHRAGLAEATPEGIRLRGTEGRTEWLAKNRRRASAGGEARAATADRGPGGKFVSAPTPNQPALVNAGSGAPDRRPRALASAVTAVQASVSSPTSGQLAASHSPAAASPTATATATATYSSLRSEPPPSPSTASPKSPEPNPEVETQAKRPKATTRTATDRDHAARGLGKHVTDWLNSHLGRKPPRLFDGYGKVPLQAARRWRKAGWDAETVRGALALRVAELRATGNHAHCRPRTLYNAKLAKYAEMHADGVRPEDLSRTDRDRHPRRALDRHGVPLGGNTHAEHAASSKRLG